MLPKPMVFDASMPGIASARDRFIWPWSCSTSRQSSPSILMDLCFILSLFGARILASAHWCQRMGIEFFPISTFFPLVYFQLFKVLFSEKPPTVRIVDPIREDLLGTNPSLYR